MLNAAGINGVGQQIAFTQLSATGGSLGLCTGTLINPRTVITAAHCVYGRPAHQYGSNTGTGGGVNGQFGTLTLTPNGTGGYTASRAVVTTQGAPISFGFKATNRCLETVVGVNSATTTTGALNGCMAETGPYEKWRNSGFQTVVEEGIYNGNQVWYRRSAQPVASGGGGEFANGDIALVTLDTHAQDVPTWTLLFSPLNSATHVTITGYGGTGVGLAGIGNLTGIDYRRRSAENMIDALMTNHDWRLNAVNSTASINDQHAIYFMDFDDPSYDPNNLPANWFNNTAPAGQRNNGYYDFNGLGGTALDNEGTTAGGDSGGPLVVDQRWAGKKVVAGVLTGSWSFNGGIATYGSFSVYPPLFPFWEEIVQNNPYKYVSALAGNGDWMDPLHWVQDMDPNYAVIDADGNLVNGLPSYAQAGGDSSGPGGAGDIAVDKFGTLCGVPFVVPTCTTFDGPGTSLAWNGTSLVTTDGPGTINFVPDNVEPVNSANAALHRKARYYDVTLREAGITTLGQAVTIDKMTVEGAAKLKITSAGTLNVWADYTQNGGRTQVDGKLNVGGDAVVVTGLLSGTGTIKSDFLTVIGGIVSPSGSGTYGTLTVDSDMILASASALFVDASRNGADKLAVKGVLALNGGSIVFNKPADSPAPRSNQSFTIATADLGVDGTFGTAYSFQGVLRPVLTYSANKIDAKFVAGSFVEILDGGNATELAFASALDALRNGFYDNLYNLYGNVDWMNAGQLSATFSALSPANMVGEVRAMHDRQNARFLGNVGDRLSLMGTGRAEGISFTGGASALAQNRDGLSASAQLGLTDGQSARIAAPGGLSGFVAMGGDTIGASYGGGEQSGQHSRYFASGIEAPFGDVMVGSAIGYAETRSMAGNDEAKSKVSQAAAYASLPVGKSAYIGGVVAAERASSDSNRLTTDTTSMFRLSGATHSARYMATAEAGVRKSIGAGLYLNPRAQLGVSHYALGGFKETGGETALALDALKVSRIESRFGAKLDGTAKLGSWSVRPNLQADYVRLLAGGDAGLKVAFAAAPDYAFALPLVGGGSGWMEVKGGLELSRGKFSLGLSGQATAGDAPIADQRGAVDLSFRF